MIHFRSCAQLIQKCLNTNIIVNIYGERILKYQAVKQFFDHYEYMILNKALLPCFFVVVKSKVLRKFLYSHYTIVIVFIPFDYEIFSFVVNYIPTNSTSLGKCILKKLKLNHCCITGVRILIYSFTLFEILFSSFLVVAITKIR